MGDTLFKRQKLGVAQPNVTVDLDRFNQRRLIRTSRTGSRVLESLPRVVLRHIKTRPKRWQADRPSKSRGMSEGTCLPVGRSSKSHSSRSNKVRRERTRSRLSREEAPKVGPEARLSSAPLLPRRVPDACHRQSYAVLGSSDVPGCPCSFSRRVLFDVRLRPSKLSTRSCPVTCFRNPFTQSRRFPHNGTGSKTTNICSCARLDAAVRRSSLRRSPFGGPPTSHLVPHFALVNLERLPLSIIQKPCPGSTVASSTRGGTRGCCGS